MNGEERALVYLWHDEDGHPMVCVTDYPNAETTVGLSQPRSFKQEPGAGWPDEAVAYAQELSRANQNCYIEYEPWAFRYLEEED